MNIRKNNIKVLIVGSENRKGISKNINNKKIFSSFSILSTSNKNFVEVKKITSPEVQTDGKETLRENKFDLAIIAVPVDKTFKVSKEIMKYI